MEHHAGTATQTSPIEVDPWSDGLAPPTVPELLHVLAPAPAMMAAAEPEPAKRFLCKDCERSFSSHQALGGHCAAHQKRFRGPREPTGNRRRRLTVKGTERRVEHVCNVCGVRYATGQALGGHKRLHYRGIVNNVKRIREVPNLMNPNAQEAPNVGSSGSGSNNGIHMGIPGCLDAANGQVLNGHGGTKPVKGDTINRLPGKHDPIPYPGSNHVGTERRFGSTSNIGLDRSKSSSEETKADFDEMREHRSNYESRRESVWINKYGYMIRFINGPNHENNAESSGWGLHDYGRIRSIVGSNNRNGETSSGVLFLCANSGDGDMDLNIGSNKGKRKQAFTGSGLGSHCSNDVDTELRLWFVVKESNKEERN